MSTQHVISIHAPQWGATVEYRIGDTAKPFQSTHPSGVRPEQAAVIQPIGDFNPRTPVGCDPAW